MELPSLRAEERYLRAVVINGTADIEKKQEYLVINNLFKAKEKVL